MKPLVVYYSRTGNTKKIAEAISSALKCDSEEITDTKKRKGPVGYMIAGRDAIRKSETKINPIQKDLGAYDLIIIGTPVWSWTVSTPIRTFLQQYKKQLKNVAFFLTHGGNYKNTFEDMATISGMQPLGTFEMDDKYLKNGIDNNRLDKFINELTKSPNL